MRALELSDALRDIANLYDNPKVIFYNYDIAQVEDVSVDSVFVVGGEVILDDYNSPVLFDLAYKKGGEWIDGDTSRD